MAEVNHRCAVLGKPIAHSLSPVLHNAAYRYLGLGDWLYGREEIGESDLPAFLDGLDDSWAGLSLTMPLKRTIQPFGERSDRWSKELHVSNTAIFDKRDGKKAIRLYNTDVLGIVRAFGHAWGDHSVRAVARSSSGCSVNGASAVILGNGNTALSTLAAMTVLQVPAIGDVTKITVCARHKHEDDALQRLASAYGDWMSYRFFPLEKAPELLAQADVAVNTIPAGGADGVARDFSRFHNDLNGATLLDVVYDPRPTALMKAWRAAGGCAIGGEEMLLYQAVTQVVLMTDGYMPPLSDTMISGPSAQAEIQGMSNMAGLEQFMRVALREAL